MRLQDAAAEAKSIPIRTILLVVFVIVLTIFAVQNWAPVYVWPLGAQKPLTLVIGISFVLGALIGWLAHSLVGSRARLAPDDTVIERNMR